MGKWCLGVMRFGCSKEGNLEVLSLDDRDKSRAEIASVSQQDDHQD